MQLRAVGSQHRRLTGMIAVNGVSKFFGSVVAVSDVSFAINGGVTALLGPNGAGKSTLFRMMCGLTTPSRGTVELLGADPRHDRSVRGRVSLVPQQDALFDHVSALDFVSVAAQTHGVDSADRGGPVGTRTGRSRRCRRQAGRSVLQGDAPAGEGRVGARERSRGVDPRRAAHRSRSGAASTAHRAVPPPRRRRPMRARVESRARRGEPGSAPGCSSSRRAAWSPAATIATCAS